LEEAILSPEPVFARPAGAGSRRRARIAPQLVTPQNSSVTGRAPVDEFWDSDHAGLFSTLLLR